MHGCAKNMKLTRQQIPSFSDIATREQIAQHLQHFSLFPSSTFTSILTLQAMICPKKQNNFPFALNLRTRGHRSLWVAVRQTSSTASHRIISCQRRASPAIRVYQHILSPQTPTPILHQPTKQPACLLVTMPHPFRSAHIHNTATEIGLLSLKINNGFQISTETP